MVKLFYTTCTYISADLEHYAIVRVKVGKRGVNMCERVQASPIGFPLYANWATKD